MKSTYVCNFADDNTLYECDKDVESVAVRLEDAVSGAFDWFKSKIMVANPQKMSSNVFGLETESRIPLRN